MTAAFDNPQREQANDALSVGTMLAVFNMDPVEQTAANGKQRSEGTSLIVGVALLGFLITGGIAGALLLDRAKAVPGKQYLWVTNSKGDDVHVIDVESRRVVKRIVVGPEPHGIDAPDAADVVFISLQNVNGERGELLWVDPYTFEIEHRMTVGHQPGNLACTPDGRWVYVPCEDGRYWVIDAARKKVVKTIRTGGQPHNTRCSRDGRWMFLSPKISSGKVTVVDVESDHRVDGEIVFSDEPLPPALSADGTRLYHHVRRLLGFEVADVPTRKVIARVRHDIPSDLKFVQSKCHGLAIRPDQQEIWSCNVEHHLVHVHDLTRDDFPQTAVIPMIGRIYWLCFTPDSRYAFVSVRSENKQCMIDCETKQIVDYIDVGDTPKRNLVIVPPERTVAQSD